MEDPINSFQLGFGMPHPEGYSQGHLNWSQPSPSSPHDSTTSYNLPSNLALQQHARPDHSIATTTSYHPPPLPPASPTGSPPFRGYVPSSESTGTPVHYSSYDFHHYDDHAFYNPPYYHYSSPLSFPTDPRYRGDFPMGQPLVGAPLHHPARPPLELLYVPTAVATTTPPLPAHQRRAAVPVSARRGTPPPLLPSSPGHVYEVQTHDVLCGRGAPSHTHSGNQYFRQLVARYQSLYLAARRADKPAIAEQIVQDVRDRGGRFLKRTKQDRLGPSGHFGWHEIGDFRAYEKTCQALREGAPEMRRRRADQEMAAIGMPSHSVRGSPRS